MARLTWNQASQNRYEFGVDHGVFYDSDNIGVVWNGLVSIVETPDGGDLKSYHFDGVKYLDFVNPKTYKAQISALSAPTQFDKALGNQPLVPGFILTRQNRQRFGLSYRTFIGDMGYKIHIIYNILAKSSQKSYSTLSESSNAESRIWELHAVPPVGLGYRPTAHFILDSTLVPSEVLTTVENILYGTDTTLARLPGFEELIDILTLLTSLSIVPEPITGLATLSAGGGDLSPTKVDGILRALPQTRLAGTAIDGIYRLELSKDGL